MFQCKVNYIHIKGDGVFSERTALDLIYSRANKTQFLSASCPDWIDLKVKHWFICITMGLLLLHIAPTTTKQLIPIN